METSTNLPRTPRTPSRLQACPCDWPGHPPHRRGDPVPIAVPAVEALLAILARAARAADEPDRGAEEDRTAEVEDPPQAERGGRRGARGMKHEARISKSETNPKHEIPMTETPGQQELARRRDAEAQEA